MVRVNVERLNSLRFGPRAIIYTDMHGWRQDLLDMGLGSPTGRPYIRIKGTLVGIRTEFSFENCILQLPCTPLAPPCRYLCLICIQIVIFFFFVVTNCRCHLRNSRKTQSSPKRGNTCILDTRGQTEIVWKFWQVNVITGSGPKPLPMVTFVKDHLLSHCL